MRPSLTGRDIVCVGFADWDSELWTNQQHLMSRLGQTNQVLFVESLGVRRPELSGRDIRRMGRRVRRSFRGPQERDGVHIVSPVVLPIHHVAAASVINRRLLSWIVGTATRHLGMHNPILWAYVPQAEMLLRALEPAFVVYHCVDDIAAQKGVDAESFRAVEGRFARRADLVMASSPALAERMRALTHRVLYLPNVADTELFAKARDGGAIDPAIGQLPRPRIVFTGAITATKVDLGLIAELASARPTWSIILVGPVGLGDSSTDVSKLAAVRNVHLVGRRRHQDLPNVLRAADAAIIPYVLNELTASVFPMKVYEYLAAGLPVVATPLASIRAVREVSFASTGAEMANALDHAMASDGPARRAARAAAAASHSWESRLGEIAQALERA